MVKKNATIDRHWLGRVMDVMRIISALLIFYYHAGLLVRLPLSRFGDHAVSTFIVLAVVASMSLGRQNEQIQFANYLWRRVKRIFPIYAAINVLIFAASYAAPSRLGRPYSIGQLLLSAFGLSQYVGQPYLSEVFWFVPFIIQVYVFIGLFGRRLLELNWPLFFCVGVCISAMAIFYLSGLMGEKLFEMRKWSPLLRLPEVGFGFLTAALVSGTISIRQYAFNLLIYLGLVALLACAALVQPDAAYLFTYPLLGLVVTALVALFSVSLCGLLDRISVSTGALRFAGRATFSFFLIHGAGLRMLYQKFGAHALAWVSYLVACVLFAVGLEVLLSALIDRRLITAQGVQK